MILFSFLKVGGTFLDSTMDSLRAIPSNKGAWVVTGNEDVIAKFDEDEENVIALKQLIYSFPGVKTASLNIAMGN